MAWIAKITDHPVRQDRLRREHAALRYLKPWAADLGIPELLSWDDQDERLCLIQSGIPGLPFDWGIRDRLKGRDIERRFRPALQWLDRFTATVPAPQPGTTGTVADLLAADLEQREELGPARNALAALIRDSRPAIRPAVAIHGDYFTFNVLHSGARIGVCDWDSFGTGTPLQDFFSYIANCGYYSRGHVYTIPERYTHAFFSQSPIARWAQNEAAGRLGFAPEELRFYFYCYVATQLHPVKNIPASTRRALLEALAARGFPGPWTW